MSTVPNPAELGRYGIMVPGTLVRYCRAPAWWLPVTWNQPFTPPATKSYRAVTLPLNCGWIGSGVPTGAARPLVQSGLLPTPKLQNGVVSRASIYDPEPDSVIGARCKLKLASTPLILALPAL